MLEAFYAFVNCKINQNKTNIIKTERLERLVLVSFLKNRFRIESARVRASNKDGRDVFLAVS